MMAENLAVVGPQMKEKDELKIFKVCNIFFTSVRVGGKRDFEPIQARKRAGIIPT